MVIQDRHLIILTHIKEIVFNHETQLLFADF